LDGVFATIGLTPLIRLKSIPKMQGVSTDILAKLEFTNPTGSLKDRIYFDMITGAISRRDLKPGMEILEASTGNAGIACAFVGTALGYRVTIVMPEGMSQERMKMIHAYGGNLITTPGGESDVDLCVKKIEELKKAAPGKYWEPNQFGNADNVNAHFTGTGPEIWDQTNGKVDCFVASQGTGGTLTGIGRFLRTKNPRVLLYAVEPREAPLLSKRMWGTHEIEGIGDGFVPHNLDVSLLSGVVSISSDESVELARELCLREGIFCGISSGCNIAAAIKVAKRHSELRSIVTMINDTGTRYFSTRLLGERKHVKIPERDHPLDPYTVEQLDKYQSQWELIR